MSDQVFNRITSELGDKTTSFETQYKVRNIGTVVEASDGIAQVSGLISVRSQELVEFEKDVLGIAFSLNNESAGIIVLGDYASISEGMTVRSIGRIAYVHVGNWLVGRVVDALGKPIDGKSPIPIKKNRPFEKQASNVMDRQDVVNPLQPGIKAIDAMIPIDKGKHSAFIY